ncbi:MAG TPA: zinc ribbon domain-containing protein [Selenomonadales bacterium]|nr:zinc ribbon domain-containing protein [Selenomonadales bacterium]
MIRAPLTPRREYCVKAAQSFLQSEGIAALPVDPFLAAAKRGWGPVPVRLLEPVQPAARLLEKVGALTIFCAGEYKIIYNGDGLTWGQVRWLIAREIGHIMLGHLRDYAAGCFPKGLPGIHCDILAREADLFAGEVLAPLPLLQILGIRSADDIARLCIVPRDFAVEQSRAVFRTRLNSYSSSVAAFFRRQFAEFIRPVAVCGGYDRALVERWWRSEQPKTDSKEVERLFEKTSYVRTDAAGRFTECPQCKNRSFSTHALFCKLCGLYLYNRCSNLVSNDPKDACNEINPGDARYCEKCGRPTVLTRLGFLKSWGEIAATTGNVADGVDPEQPFEIVAANPRLEEYRQRKHVKMPR